MATTTDDASGTSRDLRSRVRHLYFGKGEECHRFRYWLFAIDLVIVAYIIVTSFLARAPWITAIDLVCGILVAVDFLARLWITNNRRRLFKHWATWVDLIALVSFLAPLGSEGLGFVRVLRTLRLLHMYQMLERLRLDSLYFRRNEEVILAGVHLFTFVFIMTGLVYETQHWSNPHIRNYADALYFTVTTLTTTGFGDITLTGTTGRLLSVLIMLCGVTLFFRLAQVLFRPPKVRFPCPSCGLQRHDSDAVHCKACGITLNIPDDND